MSSIVVENLSVQFRSYHDISLSLKDYFSTKLRIKDRKKLHTDFWALRGISLSFNEGERVGIIGRNGAGKSTFLKTICRIYDPSEGKVAVDGRIAPLLEIGAGFHAESTGRENIYLNGAILGYKKDELQEVEKEVIEFAELQEFIDTPVKYYSTGMYMRLAFSLATTVNPEILVLDELFAGGDAAFVKRAQKRMYEMIDRSKLMVLVSHDQGLLRSLCQRFIWLDHGRVVEDGDATVLDNYNSAY